MGEVNYEHVNAVKQFDWRGFRHAIYGILAILGVVSAVAFLMWYAFWVHFVDRNELGFTYDKRTGQINKLSHTGWVVATPWFVDVHAIDLRPGQVCNNANNRVLNCKLVQFDPRGLSTFIDWHGRDAGNGANVYEILKSYAFNVNEGTDCPFLIIRDDMRRKPVASPGGVPEAETK